MLELIDIQLLFLIFFTGIFLEDKIINFVVENTQLQINWSLVAVAQLNIVAGFLIEVPIADIEALAGEVGTIGQQFLNDGSTICAAQ